MANIYTNKVGESKGSDQDFVKHPSTGNSQPIQGVLMVLLACMVWATSGIFISLIVQNWEMSAFSLAFWRDLCTFLTLLIGIAVIRPGLLMVQRKDLPWLIVMGAISIGFFHVLWNTAVLLIGASISTVVQCNAPIFVTIMAWIFLSESLTMRKLLAIGLSIVGTVLISGVLGLNTNQISTLGVVSAMISAIFYGSFSLFAKKLSGAYSPWTILLYAFGFASFALLPFQIYDPSPFPYQTPAIYYFVGLVLITTVSGFAIYTTALRRMQASIAAITATSEVLFAAILAYFILSERLDPWQILGAVSIVVGVVLISLPHGNPRAKAPA